MSLKYVNPDGIKHDKVESALWIIYPEMVTTLVQKWATREPVNGVYKTIGYFTDLEDAKRAREEAVRKTYINR